MNSFADIQKISSYSVALGEKLCAKYYSNKPVVTGPDIKSFTPVEQINLFIFKNLFEKWQEETNRLKSPYFDYTIEPVQEALKRLLNTLSNHIAISKEFFKPILFKAIEDTLLLTLTPVQYIEKEFSNESIIRKGHFQKTSKFFKVNRSLLSAIDEALSSKEAISKNDLIDYLNTKTFNEEHTKEVITALSDLIKIELNEILFEPLIKESPQSAEEPLTNATEMVAIEESEDNKAQDEVAEKIIKEDHADEVQIPEKQSTTDWNKLESEKTQAISAPQQSDEVANTTPSEKKAAEPEVSSLNDRFVRKELTLNDLLAQSTGEQQEPKVRDLRSAVPLNQRFIYIKELFSDNPTSYAVAISELEKASNLDQALSLLKLEYAPKYNWDFNSPEVIDFVRLVERRFL